MALNNACILHTHSMGWLRELMGVARPPVAGYGELARQALAHPEWPSDTQPRARSLAALFSKLDRGIELEWLADRDAAQRTLALILGCPIEAVRRVVAANTEGASGGRLRLEDLPFARSLDLRSEALPPAIPPCVTKPALWRRTWWRAPSGSGRTLTGQWLAARGLATFVSARSGDPAHRLAEPGPVFVELERREDFAAVGAALERLDICVAAPFAPPVAQWRPGGASEAWGVVECPPLLDALPALLAWVEARVPQDGAFEAGAAQAWLEAPVAEGTLPTLGAVLGVAGVLDARGVREARGKSLTGLARQFVSARLEQASVKGSAEAQWLKRHGFDALVKLAESALTTGDEAWDVARSEDEWIALVPTEFRQSVDAEWVRWSVSRSAGHGARDLERALSKAPPGAYRIVRALVDAGLLRERELGSLAVCPEFLKHAALALAEEQLVNEASPFSWGEALLRPHAAPGVLAALYRRLESDDYSSIERLLELDIAPQPALVAATEASLVCLGLRALTGAEMPVEYLEGIWNEQLGWLVELPGELPHPRLLCLDEESGFCALSQHAVWALAALAVSERLADPGARAHALLRPWRAAWLPVELTPVLDAIYAVTGRSEVAGSDWAVEAFALAGRLLGEADSALGGDLDRERFTHALARPAQLVRALLDGDSQGELAAGFGSHPLELRALQAACALERVAWPRMAHALWKNWQSRGCPEDTDVLLGPASPHAEQLWPHLPREVLEAAWARWARQARAWPFHCFGRAQWAAFVDYWGQRWHADAENPAWLDAFESMDQEWAERALEQGQLLAASADTGLPLLRAAWRRFPAWLLTLLGARLTAGDAPAVSRSLQAAPPDLDVELIRLLSEALARRTTERPVLDEARRWLSAKVSARRPGWRPAYSLLVELEQRLARSLRASRG